MLDGWLIVTISLAYIGALFFVAWWGDRNRDKPQHGFVRAVTYSISLAVYCSSWTYYGAAATATSSGWHYFAIYLGPVLTFVFCGRFIQKLVFVGTKQHSSSIADFIAARYGKSQNLALMIACFAVIGSLPYIALQLKSINTSYQIISAPIIGGSEAFIVGPNLAEWANELVIALMLAFFAIMFGTRHIDATEHHRGLMTAVAFESIIKLVAFLTVGLFIIYYVMSGFDDLWLQVEALNLKQDLFSVNQIDTRFVTMVVLSMSAIIFLPRQFHVAVVENNDVGDVKHARYILPIYLLLVSLVLVPIIVGGINTLPADMQNPEQFILNIPLFNNENTLAILVFLGGFSAATGMVIVASITLSTMVSNDIIMPLIVRFKFINMDDNDFSRWLINIRRGAIVVMMLMAYAYYRASSTEMLASIGLISFAAAIQFAPAIIGAITWRRGHRNGVKIGLSLGFLTWFYTLLLPSLDIGFINEVVAENGLFGGGWFKPHALFGFDFGDPLTHGVVMSLIVNIGCYVYFSIKSVPSLLDSMQAAAFVDNRDAPSLTPHIDDQDTMLRVWDLKNLATKILGFNQKQDYIIGLQKKYNKIFHLNDKIDFDVVQYTEEMIARAIGVSSAHKVMAGALKGTKLQIDDIIHLLGDTSKEIAFNREILRSTLEYIGHAIYVMDSSQNIIAWNKKYVDMAGYAEEYMYVGRPASDLIRFNAQNGEYGDIDVEAVVTQRKESWKKNIPRNVTRTRPDGTILQILSNPMPGGGTVVSFTDITKLVDFENALKEKDENIQFYTDNVPEIISFVDKNEKLVFANKAFHATWNFLKEEIIGQHIKDVLGAASYHVQQPHITKVLQGRKQTFDVEIFRPKIGTRYTQVSYAPQIDDNGEVGGFFAIYQDITDRRKVELELKDSHENLERRVAVRTEELSELNANLVQEIEHRVEIEEQLRDAKQLAETATKSKTRFLAAASHDLLQPLNAARLFTSVLEEDFANDDESETKEIIKNISESLKSSERLLNALLDISKLDGGGVEADNTVFPVSKLLNSLSVEFSVVAAQKGITLRTVQSNATIHCDIGLLYSILQNFVSNAVRYTATGKILLGCRRQNEHILIEVWDTGIGIDADNISEVFQEFKRLDNWATRQEKGLGLGLAITERIASVINCKISVSSVVGKGSVFRVAVPISGIAYKHQENIVTPRQEEILKGINVIAVDNEQIILDGMKKLLTRWQCDISTATNFNQTIELVDQKEKIDVIFADYQLDNDETGLELLLHLRDEYRIDFSGYIVTADKTKEVHAKISEAGFKIIQKPVDPAILRSALLSAKQLRNA
ncbi:MAG: PAS-domain containing protein [Rhizobiales bacterium]|nr:PAS-domain containing protein [Hyphomicrobiales bacterium]NRB14892.1 PAS-domain containing protein [Hyphomicrobiales bacterium]